MNTKQAVEFVSQMHGSEYDESELEITHLATVQAIGSKIEKVLKPGADLYEAMGAYMLTPEGKMLDVAVRNAVKENG